MTTVKLNRIGALLIDLILISLAYTLIYNFIPKEWLSVSLSANYGFSLERILYYGSFLAYFLLFDFTNGGDSPGKEILKLSTRGAGGKKLGPAQAVKRSLLKLASLIILPVSALLYLFGEGEFSLHDAYLKTGVFPVRTFRENTFV